MSRFIFYFVAAFIISVSAAVLQDCESPPRVENASIDIEDEDDTIRAIYKCQAGFELRGPSELLCDLDTDEWNEDPPECVHVQEDNEVEDEDAAVEEKKNKQHDIQEDRMVSPALASTLDMSCIQTKVKAPEIRHGFVKKYERRRRGDKIFLAASYECNDNFEFEDSEINTLYCGASKWLGELPVCINLGEYAEGDEEEYDDYAEENDDEEDIDTSSPQASTQKPKPAQEPKEISNEIASVENLDTHDPDTSEVTYEIEKHPPVEDTHTVTELPTIVETTQDPYTPRVVDYNCGSDKGGCEHKCERVLFPGENEPRIKCSCSAGFSLDPYDYAACHDINECAIKNGGCEQLCQNLPGSFQCTCESGLQIDTITGNTCVDINECEFPEIADECPDGCENTHGSYRCIAPLNNLENEKEKTNESNPNTEIRTLEIQECSTGYTFVDGKCLDVDECGEGSSGCENCLNLEGGYECICPPGFKLTDDGKTCIDIDECAILMAENEYEVSQKSCSHVCQNTIGSFFCTCPENQHLSNDRRTCAVDTCNDLENSELNKTRCGYDCEDLTGGSFRCLCPEGYELTEDGFNCQEMSDVCAENTCAPGTCQPSEERLEFSCICPLGYEEKDSTCVDIDECSRGNHKCSHECMNTEGNYGCACPAGFRFVDGSYNECEDINECLIQEGVCGTLNCVNLVGAFNCLCSDGSEPNLEGLCSDMLQNPCTEHPCSHECLSEGQSYRCACPGNMTLDHTLINCVEADMCAFNKNGCEQICKSEESGRCGCFDGFVLDGNGKSCIDIDECQINNGGCHQLCTNFAGSYACACETGFELAADQKNCLDIDECALGQHECSHDCVNKDGGFRCICPAGYYLGETGSLCLDIDECMVMNHGCSHNCYNTQGSYMCACPEGFALSTDGRKCLNERCNKDNGGCSHLCDPENGCGCPLGWSLSEDGKTCEDIDECLYNNGFCLHKCHNTEGSFECRCPDGSKPANGDDACPITCPAGFTLSIDNPSNCEDIDECSLPGVCEFSCRNTNGSYECLCPNGYRLENGRDCVDVDECLENNSGCVGGVCINQNGTFECKCSLGYVLSNDRKTCEKLQFEMRDQCSDFVAPINGQAHCTKYRHKKKRFYNTRCKLWCNQGYRLEGPSQRYCNASGQWDDNESQCLPIVCPRIPMPRNGVILPQSCSLGTTYIGERCRLKCSAGFVPVGKSVAVCTSQMQWSYAGIFDCMPVNTESRFSNTNDFTPSIFQTLPIQPVSNIPATYQQRPLANSGWNTPAFGSVGVQRPFIKCPRNTTVFLTNGEHTAHIILEKPNTNLDYRYIESSPAWSRDLQAHLGPGTYAVVFRGHDPVTGRKARCKTVINVRHIDGPRVVFCTNSFEVQMAENQGYRSVVWEEPRFESKYGFKKIYKSRIPGELFGIGVHNVFYEATNDDGLTAKCEFKIYVKEATAFNKPSVPSMNLTPYKDDSLLKAINNPKYTGVQRPLSLALSSSVSQSHLTPVSHPSIVNSQLLAGHESFIICPGQKPVKVTHAQTVELPPNCILKNVRLNHFRQFTSQRLLPRFWNSFYN